jgi:hypothetical protein
VSTSTTTLNGPETVEVCPCGGTLDRFGNCGRSVEAAARLVPAEPPRSAYVVQVFSAGRWAKVRGNDGGPWRTRGRAERIAELRQDAEPVGLSSTEGKPHRVTEVPA